jgi:hypothetical protein
MQVDTERVVPEDASRLITIDSYQDDLDIDMVIQCLRDDLVVLVQKVDSTQADTVISKIAGKLGMHDALRLQAELAGLYGHRHNIGRYFMSVNKRTDYQFVTAHSEGTSFAGMQLASFFCYENSTDGGETILMNIDESGSGWKLVRERVSRAKLGARQPSKQEIRQARLYQLNLPDDVLLDDDIVLDEQKSQIAEITLVTALAKPRQTYSRILEKNVNAYWDSIDGSDYDSVYEFEYMLRYLRLLKEPPGGLDIARMDSEAKRRIWHSGVKYKDIFKARLVRKLVAGDLIIQNNLTWTHAVNNWSPGNGVRKVAAAFA